MEYIDIIVTIIKIVSGAIITAIPMIVAIISKCKKLKTAKSNEEQTSAVNDIVEKAKQLIILAENTYAEVDTALKVNKLGSAGVFKKESVLSKLESYSATKGYSFTTEELSNVIEDLVSFSNTVNANK